MDFIKDIMDFSKMEHLRFYLGWVVFFLIIFIVPAAYEVWNNIKINCNHKGYWLDGVDLVKYIDDIPISLMDESEVDEL